MKNVFNKNFCRLCKSKNLDIIYKLAPTPIGDDYLKSSKTKVNFYDLNLKNCKSCNFVQLSNVIDPKKVYGDYIYVTKTSVGLPKHFQFLLELLIKKYKLNNNSKVLEIGCNDGTLLRLINKKAKFAIGVDPATTLKPKNLKIYKSMFNDNISHKLKNIYGEFDFIIANNVIANIDNLDNVFKNIKLILKKNGIFVMETFSLYGLLRNNLIDNIYHEHISYFSIKSFNDYLRKMQLKIIFAEHLNVKGGSLRLFISKIDSENRQKSFALIQKKEEKLFKNIVKKFKRIKDINKNNQIKINNFLKKETKKKKLIIGYGASVGTTTLMYYYKLKNYIDSFCDDEKKRHYLYSPGTKLQILPPSQLSEIKPNYIIIFAWRYADQILKKNRKLFKKGIKFILPLPKFKIIKKCPKKYL